MCSSDDNGSELSIHQPLNDKLRSLYISRVINDKNALGWAHLARLSVTNHFEAEIDFLWEVTATKKNQPQVSLIFMMWVTLLRRIVVTRKNFVLYFIT